MRDGDAHTREQPASDLNRSGLWNPKLILLPGRIVLAWYSAAAGRQAFSRIDTVVKGHNRVVKFLVSLMSLARDQDTVPRLGHLDYFINGPAPVQFHPELIRSDAAIA